MRLEGIYSDYCDDCASTGSATSCNHNNSSAFKFNLNADETPINSPLKEVEEAYKKLFAAGVYLASDILKYKGLIDATYKVFKSALDKGITDNVIPKAMMTSLEKDVFVFSALKTHAQLFEASRLLLDENGKLKSFQKFSQDVKKIKEDYNENYLEAEYEFARSSAQMAAKWAEVESNNGRYNLQYRTAKDDKVREDHAMLADITLPADDDFWKKYYPPNGWRCRCTAVEVRKSKYEVSDSIKANKRGDNATTQIGKDGRNRLEIFRFNPGRDKIVFPPNHPYNKLQGAKYIRDLKYRDVVFSKPLEQQYSSIYKSNSGGKVLVHDFADIKSPRVKSDDYLDRVEAAKSLARKGYVVRVLPEIAKDDIKYRAKLFKGYTHPTANPDFLIDGQYADLKRPESIRRILYNANKSSKDQNSIAVITDRYLNKEISEKVLKDRMADILSAKNKNNYTFNKVYFIYKGKLKEFD